MNTTIDFTRLIDLTGGRATFLLSLLKKIEESVAVSPQEIQSAFNANDLLQTRELAHKFKSSVMYLSHSKINEALDTIEYSEKNNLPSEEIAANVKAVILYSEEILTAIQSKITELEK